MTIDQMDAIIERLVEKKYPNVSCSKRHTWRCERIINRLIPMIREKRIKEGKYYNGL